MVKLDQRALKMDKTCIKKRYASHLNSHSSKTIGARLLGLVPIFQKLKFTSHTGRFETKKCYILASGKVKLHQKGLKCMKYPLGFYLNSRSSKTFLAKAFRLVLCSPNCNLHPMSVFLKLRKVNLGLE